MFYRILRTETITTEKAKTLAMAFAQEIGKIIPIEKVYLIGSAAGWSHMQEGSDIDLVVKGMSPGAWGQIAALLSGKRTHLIDLRRYEECSEHLREKIDKKGLVLCEGGIYG